jgi:hypothetical protein
VNGIPAELAQQRAQALPQPAPAAKQDAAARADAESVTVTAESSLLKTDTGAVANTAALPPLPAGGPAAPLAGGPAAAKGKAKGGAGGGGARGGFAATAAAVIAPPFSHEFLANGRIRIIPATEGTLLVTAGEREMFPRNPVVATTPIELPVPVGATQIRMEFTAPNTQPVVITAVVPTPPAPSQNK